MKKLKFGCGKRIEDVNDGWVNVDAQVNENIQKSFDFNVFPYPFEDDTFDYVLVQRVLHDLISPTKVLKELRRISKQGAIIKIIEPYANCSSAYTGLDHLHYFNDQAFTRFANSDEAYNFDSKPIFKIRSLEMIPTRLGMLIPTKKIRRLASYVLGEIINEIEVEYEVIK